jgi:type IV pilus biogenesis protein PilP
VVDAPNGFEPQQIPPVMPSMDEPPGFLASGTAKIVMAGLAFVLVLGVVGAIVYFFVLTPSSPSGSGSNAGAAATVTGSLSSVASGSADPLAAAPIVDPMEKPLESTFTFRNIFAPTLQEQFPVVVTSTPAKTSSSSSSSSSTSTTVKVPANTLFLESIQTVNGRTTATFIWNNQTYVLAKGDGIPSTPWKVLSIGNSSVVMEFGDTEVTLTTGQGLTK